MSLKHLFHHVEVVVVNGFQDLFGMNTSSNNNQYNYGIGNTGGISSANNQSGTDGSYYTN